MMKLFVYLLCCCPYLVAGARTPSRRKGLPPNERPYIGVLALPPIGGLEYDYVQASYERFLMAAGAIPTPIPTNLTMDEVDYLYSQLNGVLLTGGPKKPTDFPGYFATATRLYENTLQAYEKNEYIPFWATCLGFQTLVGISAGGADVLLNNTGVTTVSMPLEWTDSTERSRIFGNLPARFKKLFERETTSNRHSYGIDQEIFDNYLAPLGFHVVSTNVDDNNVRFISTFEHKEAPIYAVQWHPEASQANENDWIPRLPEDIEASQYVGRFIASEARKNDRRPSIRLPRIEEYTRIQYGRWNEWYYLINPEDTARIVAATGDDAEADFETGATNNKQ